MRNLTAIATATAMLLVLPALAEGEKKKEEPPPKPPPKSDKADPKAAKTTEDEATKKGDEPVVFTTEWLEERYGSGAAAEVSAITRRDGSTVAEETASDPDAVVLPDALTEMEDEKARAKDRELMIGRLDREIGAMDDRIAALERRILAVKNPFLPRPQIPEEEQAEWELMSAPERVDSTQAKIDDLRRQVQGLRERRDALARGR